MRRRRAADHLQAVHGVSERHACRVLDQPRSTQRYRAKEPPDDEAALVADMRRHAAKHLRFGYRRVRALLCREGWSVSLGRVQRLWRREGLRVPQKRRKRRRLGTSKNGCTRLAAERPNHVWSYDFVMDRTEDGRQLKILTMVDEYTRENLCL